MIDVRFEVTRMDGKLDRVFAKYETMPNFTVGDMIEINGDMFWCHTRIWRTRLSVERNDEVFGLIVGVEEIEEDDARYS